MRKRTIVGYKANVTTPTLKKVIKLFEAFGYEYEVMTPREWGDTYYKKTSGNARVFDENDKQIFFNVYELDRILIQENRRKLRTIMKKNGIFEIS